MDGSLMAGREFGDRALEEMLQLVVGEQLIGGTTEVFNTFEREFGAATRGTALVRTRNGACLPDSECERPTERGAAGLVTVGLLEELHHCSLRSIVSIGSVSSNAGADGVDAGVERPEDETEGRAVAIGNPREEAIELVRMQQGLVTTAAGSGGAATVSVVAGAGAVVTGAASRALFSPAAGANGAIGLDCVARAAVGTVAARGGLGLGRLRSGLATITCVGHGCGKHHRGERNSQKDETEDSHGDLVITAPRVGLEKMGRSLPECDTL